MHRDLQRSRNTLTPPRNRLLSYTRPSFQLLKVDTREQARKGVMACLRPGAKLTFFLSFRLALGPSSSALRRCFLLLRLPSPSSPPRPPCSPSIPPPLCPPDTTPSGAGRGDFFTNLRPASSDMRSSTTYPDPSSPGSVVVENFQPSMSHSAKKNAETQKTKNDESSSEYMKPIARGLSHGTSLDGTGTGIVLSHILASLTFQYASNASDH